MPDGVRTLVVGGTRSQNNTTLVPTVEIFSSNARGSVSLTTLSVLQRFRNFILYPVGELARDSSAVMLAAGPAAE
jgi:hypothetical protein